MVRNRLDERRFTPEVAFAGKLASLQIICGRNRAANARLERPYPGIRDRKEIFVG